MKKETILRIYPEQKSLYFEVGIYPDRNKMRMAIKKEIVAEVPSDTQAYCSCSRTLKPPHYKKSRKIGKVFFYKDQLGVNTVTHEMTHAANGFMAEKGFKSLTFTTGLADDLEERFCYLLGALVGDFYAKAQKLGLC